MKVEAPAWMRSLPSITDPSKTMGEIIDEEKAHPRFKKRIAWVPQNDGDFEIQFRLIGPEGAAVLCLRVFESSLVQGRNRVVQPFGIDMHWSRPLWDGQGPARTKCNVLPGQCYMDRALYAADAAYDILMSRGEEALWSELEDWYKSRAEMAEELASKSE